MKRTRTTRDRLTGGTNDVNPQLIHSPPLAVPTAVAPLVVGMAELVINLPINRLNNRSGHSTIVEILKVFFDLPAPAGVVPQDGYTSQLMKAILSTRSLLGQSQVNVADPSIICSRGYNIRWAQGTELGSAAIAFTDPIDVDLTDGAGHGLLVAVDKLYFTGETVNQSTQGIGQIMNCKIMYRFKEVTLEEYIGIVQGQQSAS